jgi:GcrA cell cycle regulator
MSWTDERIEKLTKMWESGATASQIAEELGAVSRNAVIGKAHRLGLKARPSPVKPNEAKSKARPAKKAKAPAAAPAPTPVREAKPASPPTVEATPVVEEPEAVAPSAPASSAPADGAASPTLVAAAPDRPRIVSVGPCVRVPAISRRPSPPRRPAVWCRPSPAPRLPRRPACWI